MIDLLLFHLFARNFVQNQPNLMVTMAYKHSNESITKQALTILFIVILFC